MTELHFYNLYLDTGTAYYCNCGKGFTTIRGVLNHVRRIEDKEEMRA